MKRSVRATDVDDDVALTLILTLSMAAADPRPVDWVVELFPGVKRPVVGAVIDRLERQGYVRRLGVNAIMLTPEGARRVRNADLTEG